MNKCGMEIIKLESFEELCEIKDEWEALSASAVKTIFLTHNWLTRWWMVFHEDSQLWVLVARDAEGLAGVAPLMLRRGSGGLRCLTFIGVGEVTPNHLDFIVRPGSRDSIESMFVEYLCRHSSQWDLLDLDKLPGDTGVAERLRDLLVGRGLAARLELSARCPYVDLPDTFEEYLRNRNDRNRRRLRHWRKRLLEADPPISAAMASTSEEVSRVMSALVEQHQARWTKLGHPGSFANPNMVRFHHEVAQGALKEGSLRLSYFRSGEDIVAVRYGFRAGDCQQAYMTSFDERWSSLGPSILILGYVFEQAIQEGVRRYDTLEGEEPYKYLWVDSTRDNVRLRVFSSHLRGKLARARTEAGAKLRDLALRCIPVGVRRPIYKKLILLNASLRGRSDGNSGAKEEKAPNDA